MHSGCKTGKFLTGSLTGSRKVIEILNRLGHCVSYNLVEEIKTELTYAANEKDILPNPFRDEYGRKCMYWFGIR